MTYPDTVDIEWIGRLVWTDQGYVLDKRGPVQSIEQGHTEPRSRLSVAQSPADDRATLARPIETGHNSPGEF